MGRRNNGTGGFPQEEFENVCFHSIGLIEQNQEYLEMHLRAVSDLPARQALSDIRVEAARLERAVQNITTLLRLRDEEPGEPELLDLSSLLWQVGSLAQEIDASLGITLETETDGADGYRVMAFPDEAEQLLLHLVSNALRACGSSGRVRVSLSQKKGSAVLCVEDDGCGLPEKAPVENHRCFLGGTGMGLEICRLICRRVGWRLTLKPRPEGGTCAQVVCPLALEEDIPAVMEFHSAAENELHDALFHGKAEREILLLRRY